MTRFILTSLRPTRSCARKSPRCGATRAAGSIGPSKRAPARPSALPPALEGRDLRGVHPFATAHATPAPPQIIEHVGVQVAAVRAAGLVSEVARLDDELGAAGGFGQQLHLAGALELQ